MSSAGSMGVPALDTYMLACSSTPALSTHEPRPLASGASCIAMQSMLSDPSVLSSLGLADADAEERLRAKQRFAPNLWLDRHLQTCCNTTRSTRDSIHN
jgi:hypothetical protein